MPPSFRLISAPSASRLISPATSIVKSPLDKSISVPSMVMLSIETPASAVTAPVTSSVPPMVALPLPLKTSTVVVPARFKSVKASTTGSQNIIISQGSGANVTIPAGHVKAVYSDGS